MRRLVLALAFAFCLAAITAGSTGAATSKSAFAVFVEPTISAASNGLTLQSELEGSFNVADKTATGSGTYAVMAGATVVDSGTFTLTRLIAFQFYGCGEVEGTALPAVTAATASRNASANAKRLIFSPLPVKEGLSVLDERGDFQELRGDPPTRAVAEAC